MNHMVVRFLAVAILLSSCSQSEFSGGESYPGPNKSNTKTPVNNAVSSKAEIFLATDIATVINSDGVAGSCNQAILTAGKLIYEGKILPFISSNPNGKARSLPFYFHSDILINIVAATCAKNETSWVKTSSTLVCQRTSGGLGPSRLDQEFGTASVCGESFTGQNPIQATDENISTFSVEGEGKRHLVIATHKLGSSISAEKFVAIMKKKLGDTLQISIIYPKTSSQCVSSGINPSDDDTMWRGLPSSARGPSSVFEQIASLTGARTYDLCSPTDLENLKNLKP